MNRDRLAKLKRFGIEESSIKQHGYSKQDMRSNMRKWIRETDQEKKNDKI